MKIFDANVILRYILNDNADLADKAAKFISEGNVLITNEVIAEVVFVLSGRIYKIERNRIKSALIAFLDEVDSQNEVIRKALDAYGETKLDFVDCLLYAYNKLNSDEICTFDQELIKLLNEIKE